MTKTKRIVVYLIGVAIGALIVAKWMPQRQRDPHPWHNRTAAIGHYPLDFTDAAGRKVHLQWQPRRLASLAPSVTELVFAMGVGDQLFAVTDFCAVPGGSESLPSLGQMTEPNREILTQLRPDLIIGSNLTPRRVYEQLEDLRLKAVMLRFDRFDDVIQSIQDIGTMIGVPAPAYALARDLLNTREAILSRVPADSSEPRTLLVYDVTHLSSAGAGSWPGDFLNDLKTENIAEAAPSSWPRLSRESIIVADPEIVLVLGNTQDPARLRSMREQIQAWSSDPMWQQTSAVRNGRVHILDESLFLVPGPRMLDALAAMAEVIYGIDVSIGGTDGRSPRAETTTDR